MHLSRRQLRPCVNLNSVTFPCLYKVFIVSSEQHAGLRHSLMTALPSFLNRVSCYFSCVPGRNLKGNTHRQVLPDGKVLRFDITKVQVMRKVILKVVHHVQEAQGNSRNHVHLS